MQNLLLYIKNNLTPTLAQILLQALKNSNNEKFFTFVKQFALGSILTNLGIDIYQQNILIHL